MYCASFCNYRPRLKCVTDRDKYVGLVKKKTSFFRRKYKFKIKELFGE